MCTLSGALIKLNIKAKSWLNWQIPILTEGEHTNARIINMHIEKINKYLEEDGVAIIPGFQGISKMEISPQLEEEVLTQQPWRLQRYSMLIYVKYIQMWMEFFQLIQIKYQLQRKLIKFLMMKCLNYLPWVQK